MRRSSKSNLEEHTTESKAALRFELGSLTRPEVEQVVGGKPVIVIPVGAIEQHGAHLPVDTDAFLVTQVGREAVCSLGDRSRAILSPTIAVGCSEHHLSFAGTISLSHRTFIEVVNQHVKSLANHGFETFLLLNGHGGNSAALGVAAEELAMELPSVTVATTSYWLLIQDVISHARKSPPGGMGHAGEFETALSLHLRPEFVYSEHMVRCLPENPVSGCSRDLIQKGPVTVPWRVAEETPSGVVGDPHLATAEAGRVLFEAAVRAVADLLIELRNRNRQNER